MLYECNFPRLVMMKYSPLILGLLILFGFIPKIINDNTDLWPALLLPITFPFFISIILFAIFFKIRSKLKYVAIGKSKLIVRRNAKEVEYNWLDVETITLNRFFGVYKLKIKNEDEIYFTAYGTTTWLTGDSSEMGVIINKMKNELSI